MKKSILLIDGYSVLNRAFYGLPLLSNSKGLYTNAAYGFLNIFFKAVEDISPGYAAVAFDLAAPTFRHKMYDKYKGNRKKMPEELRQQVPLIKSILDAMNVAILQKEGFEADDIIGSQAVRAVKEGMKVTIVSGDRDLLQLVNNDVTLLLPKTSRGSTTVECFTPERVREIYKIGPECIVDLKAMMGDASDNIPGLPGVGEKTATNLIIQYGTFENAAAHYEEIKPQKAMVAFRDYYELGEISKNLAKIKTDVDMEISIENLAVRNFYTSKAYSIFKELEFKKFLTRFDDKNKSGPSKPEMKLITEKSEAIELIQAALKNDHIGFDLDIIRENRKRTVCGFALAFRGKCCYVKTAYSDAVEFIKDRLEVIIKNDCALSVIGFKEQQNILVMEKTRRVFDCLIAAYLLDPLRSDYTYEQISAQYADIALPSIEEICGSKINKKTVLSEEQRQKIAMLRAYAADAAKKALEKKLSHAGMEDLFNKIEMPLVYTLSAMESAGIKMNSDELSDFSDELFVRIKELENSIYEKAEERFNINSPKQLGRILFEKMRLPGGKKTKTGYSTAGDILEKLAVKAPIAYDILKYRQLAKLKSTYADSLPDYVEEDGRIHSHFLQSVTATGRISSADPNLQNIPVRMEIGRKIRRVFVPDEGCVFIDADYSQIELRVLAHMSEDEGLIEAYKKDRDIHRITASQVFGVPSELVSQKMRRNAKAVNFGIVYGISSFGLSQDLSISRKEAQSYIDKYFETYPGIKRYLDSTVKDAGNKGYTTTLFGRRRPIPELKSSNYIQRQFGERASMNSPIQGTAADIIKIAMNNVSDRFLKEKLSAKLILQVHDELLVEAPENEKGIVCKILREEMENAASLLVDLAVDINTGYNWDEAH